MPTPASIGEMGISPVIYSLSLSEERAQSRLLETIAAGPGAFPSKS